jgi:hypothetical protein
VSKLRTLFRMILRTMALTALATISPAIAQYWNIPAYTLWHPLQNTSDHATGSETEYAPRQIIIIQKIVREDSAILDEESIDGRARIPAKTKLFGAFKEYDKDRIYCTFKTFSNENLFGREYFCFEDSNADKKFDIRYGAMIFFGEIGMLSVDRIGHSEKIFPVSYHAIEKENDESPAYIAIRFKKISKSRDKAYFSYGWGMSNDRIRYQDDKEVSLQKLPAEVEVLGARLQILATNGNGIKVRLLNQIPDEGLVLRYK